MGSSSFSMRVGRSLCSACSTLLLGPEWKLGLKSQPGSAFAVEVAELNAVSCFSCAYRELCFPNRSLQNQPGLLSALPSYLIGAQTVKWGGWQEHEVLSPAS